MDKTKLKACSQCKQSKPLSDFFVHNVGRKQGKPFSACKECESGRGKEYRRRVAQVDKNPPPYKKCALCGEIKPIEHFGNWRTTPDGKNYRCKECCSTYTIQKRYDSSPQIAHKLGLTTSEVRAIRERMVACEVCGQTKDEARLCIDHDHKTGKVRGVLCNNCNAGLGFLDDSLDLVLSLAEYIRTYSD